MKSFTNLREACVVFLFLLVMAILNAGMLWEGERISHQYACLELMNLLELNEVQIEKIESIQAAYERGVSNVTKESAGPATDKIQLLRLERSRKIMDVLNEQQRRTMQSYCTDLVSFGNKSE